MNRIIAAKTAKARPKLRAGAWLGTVSAMTLALILSLTAASQPGAAQQITKGGGDGGIGLTFVGAGGSGGIAGGGGVGGVGGGAALDPAQGATRGSGSGPGEAGNPNDVSAGGGGAGLDNGGGNGGGGHVDAETTTVTLNANKVGGDGGSSGGDSSGGGGGGGLVLTGSGVVLYTDGHDIAGGKGGSSGDGGGGGGAGLVLIGGGTANIGTSSTITGGAGGNNGARAGQAGAGVFLYDGGTLNNTAGGTVKGGAGGVGTGGSLGGTAVLSNQGIIDNQATLIGGAGGSGGVFSFGGGGGGGIQAWGGAVTNRASGVISGGGRANVVGGVGGNGGSGVAFLSGQTAVLANHGIIRGGDGGPADFGNAVGMGGVGVAGALTGQTTVINSGMIEGGLGGDFITRADAVRFAGGGNRLELWAGYGFSGNVVAGSGDVLALGGATNGTFDASLIGTAQYQGFGALEKSGASTWTLTGTSTFTGPTTVNGGTLTGGVANTFSAASATTVNATGILDLGSFAQTINAVSLAGGTLTNGSLTGAVTSAGGTINGLGGAATVTTTGGITSVTGSNTYSGVTMVNGGLLSVDGSIASSTTVNFGGTLGGNGIVGDTTINAGGALAPGNSIGLLTVQGDLVFMAASSYMVEVSPDNADRTNVTQKATLGGATVKASFAAGSYIARQYTILHADDGVTDTFGTEVNTNLPTNFHTALSYDDKNAYLNLILNFAVPSGLNRNQQNVGDTLTNFFNTTGGIPLAFGALSPQGLTQVSGETATGSQQTTFDAMNLFMGLLTDPFVAGRGDPVSASGGAPQFAEDSSASAYASKPRSRSERDAYAAIYRKAPPMAGSFAQRWSVWAAGYGGSQTTDGNATLGSNSTTSRIAGTAVGADYRFSPFTLAGFALAGGGTNFSVANGLGSGRSDLFQAGAFLRHTVGPAYISAALAYGWQDITTDRTITVAGVDQLRAKFNANAFSGRLEGGYRFVTPAMGITPYAAAQVTTFDLPAYAEQAVSGSNTFALAYAAKEVTASRSELGLRTDKSFAVQDGIFTLRGRVAWAHNFDTDRSVLPTFQALPGASFVVNGAAQAADAALATASAEMKWLNGFSVAGTFEGEFSDVTESYAGKGVVRYAC